MTRPKGWLGLLGAVEVLVVILATITLGLVLSHAALTAANTWRSTGNLATSRHSHSATLLSNGRVLVAGGRGNRTTLASAELYNPLSK